MVKVDFFGGFRQFGLAKQVILEEGVFEGGSQLLTPVEHLEDQFEHF